MELLATYFGAVKLLAVQPVDDTRGGKLVSYSHGQAQALGIDFCLQEERVYRPRAGAFFGIHFQNHPQPQSKLITLLSGCGQDVIVDLRRTASTFGQWQLLELAADAANTLFIPPGFGHGFLARSADVLMLFRVDRAFDPALSLAISYRDLALGLPLQIDEALLSPQDRDAPPLALSPCNL